MSTPVTAAARKQPLDEVMLAMDVVDTIRHRQLIVERELDAAGRRERLIERLREIYTAQGIEVTDAALAAGVDALEQQQLLGVLARRGGLRITTQHSGDLLDFFLFAQYIHGGLH